MASLSNLSAQLTNPTAPKSRTAAARTPYFRCLACSDLVPVAARRPLSCSCSCVTQRPLHLGAPMETPQNAELVKVLAKAPLMSWW